MTTLVDIVALVFGTVLETLGDAWEHADGWTRAGVITVLVLVLLLALVCLTGSTPTNADPASWAVKR